MTHSDWLQTIAELAIGLAGFAALIASMRERDDASSLENAGRAMAVVETTFSTLALCLIPVLLHGLGFSESHAFRTSGAVAFVVALPMGIRGIRRATAARRKSANPLRPIPSLIALVGVILSIGAAIVCALGRPSEFVPTYYLCVLSGTLMIASMNFVTFVIAQHESPRA